MNTTAIKKTDIIKQLDSASEKELDRIKILIESVFKESMRTVQGNHSLKGIWQDKGFEQLEDIEKEIEHIRKELGESIIKNEL